jgi:hypothetical protein
MKSRFTGVKIIEIFRQWPQAVSTDDGDLRVLHDMANAGAQSWRERLLWPDYLWLDFEGELPNEAVATPCKETYKIIDPTGRGRDAAFSTIKEFINKSQLPASGKFRISNRVSCIIELKIIETDLVQKLSTYNRSMQWSDFVQMKFDHWFRNRLREADSQIAGGKQLLPFQDACGIVVIVNERSLSLPTNLAVGYLTRAIDQFPNVDAVLYLADRGEKTYAPALVLKHNDNDSRLRRFSTQISMMLSSFNYEGDLPVHRSGPQPELIARIEMDQRSRAMYRSWATGWRQVDDPTPIPSPSMAISFVPREQFISGLPPTLPDQKLLDCRLHWDPDLKNLRVEKAY